MSLEINNPAPDFQTTDTFDKPVTLQDFRGQWVVLYFYPKDDTPGCTKQACSFRDNMENFRSKNAVIVGVSPDESASHKKFTEKYQLPFILLTDTDHSLAEIYGVWKEKNLYGHKKMGIERTTFLINPQGIIVKIWKRVRVDGHIEQVLAEIP